MNKVFAGVSLALFTPALVMAQIGSDSDLDGVETFVESLGNIVELLIPIAFAAALLFFFWGLARYILAAGNEEAKESGKNIMIWGVIALFVMASVWGIVAFIGDFFGIQQGGDAPVPGIRD